MRGSRLEKTADFGDRLRLRIFQGSLHKGNNRGVSLDSPESLDLARGDIGSVQKEVDKRFHSLLDCRGGRLPHDLPVDGENLLIGAAGAVGL